MSQKRCDNTEDFKYGKFQRLKNAIFMKNQYILTPALLILPLSGPIFPAIRITRVCNIFEDKYRANL
jgi:hypothetical protein